jgi:hypothetical protein
MGEIEEQLARLAARRGDSVTPYTWSGADEVGRRRATRRMATVVAIAACVALLVGGAFVLFSGSDDSPSVHTPAATEGPTVAPSTAPPSTAATIPPPTCAPLDGADDAPKQGDAVAHTVASGTPMLANVQAQASDCVDEVVFAFGNGAPAWSVNSDAATASYQVTFQSPVSETLYQDGTEVAPVAPSAVRRVSRLAGVDGSMTWRIELDAQHPFRIDAREGVLGVQFATVPSPRPVTCSLAAEHVEYEVPPGWFVETSPGFRPCAVFAPEPFVILPGTDGPFVFGSIGVSTAGTDPGPTNTVLSSSATKVGGRAATVREIEATGGGLFPAGYRTYEYVADWAPSGTLVVSIGSVPAADYDTRKAGLDAIAASVRYLG